MAQVAITVFIPFVIVQSAFTQVNRAKYPLTELITTAAWPKAVWRVAHRFCNFCPRHSHGGPHPCFFLQAWAAMLPAPFAL
jgi:hypothetical protein